MDQMILDNSSINPQAQIQPEISDSTRNFFQYLEHATSEIGPDRPVESAVDDFVSHLFGPLAVLKYDAQDRLIRQRMEITFKMCGNDVKAQPNVSILSGNKNFILVNEDKV